MKNLENKTIIITGAAKGFGPAAAKELLNGMKNILILSLIIISAIALNSCSSGNAGTTINNENVAFYEVPLVCGAYAEIGCGSRAKPALMDLEKNANVKEAWLNRQGTVFAIVWKGSDETKAIAKPVFDKYEIEYAALKGNDAKENIATFRKENLWYRGTDVDKLSIEEATHIANTLANFALERKLITQEEAGKLIPQVERYFKAELVKVRTPEELYSDSRTKFSDDLISISEPVLGPERTKNILTLYSRYKQEECEKSASSCDKKGEKKDCCRKK